MDWNEICGALRSPCSLARCTSIRMDNWKDEVRAKENADEEEHDKDCTCVDNMSEEEVARTPLPAILQFLIL